MSMKNEDINDSAPIHTHRPTINNKQFQRHFKRTNQKAVLLTDNEGKTPLTQLTSPPNGWFYLAGRLWKPSPSDRENSVILLVGAGCDPLVKDGYGRPAIHYGARNGYLGVLKVIVNRRGNWEVPDKYGRTPLDYARERVCIDVVQFLKGKRGGVDVKTTSI